MTQHSNKFDVIVIGGGFAGLSAALRLVHTGHKDVLVIERGPVCGSKTLTGGRAYDYAFKELLGDAWKKAPLQREVTREVITMLTERDAFNIDTTFSDVRDQSHTILAAPFCEWLADEVEKDGGVVVTGQTVDGLILDGQTVKGVKVAGEEILCDVLIDAEGLNALVAERAGLIQPLTAKASAVAAKYTFKLSAEEITKRFNAPDDKQGTAMLGMGAVSKGVFGGLFLYTDNTEVSLGLVLDAQAWKESGISIHETLEDAKLHPAIARYLEGAELHEYGAHLIYEGGYKGLPKCHGDGWVLLGDAAGLCINRGFTVRGIDYAIMSGIAAAQAVGAALDAHDFSDTKLAHYEALLDKGVRADLRKLADGHDWMVGTPDLVNTYPDLIVDMMKDLYHVDDKPLKSAREVVKDATRGMKMLSTAVHFYKGSRSL
jgi:electron transfer flavoprotein-quinone oxidoreductase